jgi:hypothetical protein
MLISSAYFRNMPEHSSELFRQSEKIVHLGVDSERFAKLLSFLNDGPQARARLDWPSLKAIAETGERYQFDVVPDLVARGAVSLLRSRRILSIPYDIFKFAAQHDYYELARLAILSFGDSTEFQDVSEISELDAECFDGVSGKYVAVFFQAMAATPATDDRNWDWDKTSAEFYV